MEVGLEYNCPLKLELSRYDLAFVLFRIVFRLKKGYCFGYFGWIRFPEKAHHRKVFLVAKYDDAYAMKILCIHCLYDAVLDES